jgi:hypothetical protein
VGLASELCLPTALTLVSCSAYSLTLKMEAICSSETSVEFQRSTQCYGAFRPVRLAPSCRASPMPLLMQLCVRLAPCLFLMHAHASSYSHQDRSTHALFGLQAALLLRHVFIVHLSEVRSKAFYFVQSCFRCPHLIYVLEEL